MSAPAQVTEAHKQLVATIVEQAFRFAEGNHKITPLSQIIADSEAKAVQAAQDIKSEWAYATMVERNQLRAEIAQLRAQVALDEKAKALMLKGHFRDVDEMTKLRAEVERLKATPQTLENAVRWEDCERMQARAERAEAEVDQLRDGLRDSEAALALNTLRAERAEAELSAEQDMRSCVEAELHGDRARLDWLAESWDNPLSINLHPSYGWSAASKNIRAAIDAAMKEGDK